MSGVMGPAWEGLWPGPRLLSELLEDTEPLRADTALWRALPAVAVAVAVAPPPLATHCECLHAARLQAWRADLSGNTDLSTPLTQMLLLQSFISYNLYFVSFKFITYSH